MKQVVPTFSEFLNEGLIEKYKLTKETINVTPFTLYRIEALKSFGKIKKVIKVDLLRKKKNLSHFGNAKVSENAQVFENAYVLENAQVFGNAQVYGETQVYENAKVSK